ncbi:hypothetical protein ACROYT_G006255 [Oculina patagonica]
MGMNLFEISCVVLIAHLSLLQVNADAESSFNQELPSYEFVSPRLHQQDRWKRDTSAKSSSDKNSGRAVISLRGFGKDFVLDVVQNRVLLSANYVSRYFDADGGEIINKNESNDNCFYQGTVQGLKHSVVAISTCQGIEGMIYDGNETYYVQPLPGDMNRHIMYRTKDLRMGDKRCGVKHSDIPSSVDELVTLGKHRTRRNVDSETKFVELLIVNDRSQYLDFKSNRTAVEYRSKNIANLVDSLYRPLNVRIALTAVEIWTQSDKIVVDEDSDKCLDNFMKYRNEELVKKYDHDNAQLLTHRGFKGSTVGKASVMAMCGEKSGGVVQDHSFSAAATAATLAHEMGHNFGLIHDEDIKGCKCNAPAENQGCIMSAVAKSKPSVEWSSCSFDSFDKYLHRGLDACLFDKPSTLFGDAVCGNGFKEEGEECDCGTIEECEKYSENCCNATTCKLHPDSECDTGPCCFNCKLRPEGWVCREKFNECDLPESCTGKSELCPSNKYVRDGMPCADNKGYCYKSECPTHDVQCQDLWGPDALSGPDICYGMNEKGTVIGNCHQGDNVYLKCARKDRQCGMLQCTNIDDVDLPIIGRHRSSYPYKYGSTICKSASVSLGLDVPDPGETVDGTKCGENKLCVNRKCTSIETFTAGLKPCPNNCSDGNGVCNNEFECFCYSCWQGPDCSLWVECNTQATEEPEARRSNLAGILIAVFLIIFLLVGAICAFIYRKQLMEKWRAFQQKAPGSKRYQGVSTGSPKQGRAARYKAGATAKTNVEAPKPRLPRPAISGPTLTSTTRAEPTVTITPNPLGTAMFPAEPVKQTQPAAQPQVAFKPTPPKPAKPEPPAVEKEERPPKFPPVALRNREWPPKGDKKNSLNRASSPPVVTEPVKPVKPLKPPRPESHAGILDKAPVRPPPAKKGPREWPPHDQKKNASPEPDQSAKPAGSQPKVALKPVPKPIDKRFPKRPSEERPTSLPLKPSDIKKGLKAGNERPLSDAHAGLKKAPLKPPGPIPPRPASKPT